MLTVHVVLLILSSRGCLPSVSLLARCFARRLRPSTCLLSSTSCARDAPHPLARARTRARPTPAFPSNFDHHPRLPLLPLRPTGSARRTDGVSLPSILRIAYPQQLARGLQQAAPTGDQAPPTGRPGRSRHRLLGHTQERGERVRKGGGARAQVACCRLGERTVARVWHDELMLVLRGRPCLLARREGSVARIAGGTPERCPVVDGSGLAVGRRVVPVPRAVR